MSLEATLNRNESLPYLIALDERLATFLVKTGRQSTAGCRRFPAKGAGTSRYCGRLPHGRIPVSQSLPAMPGSRVRSSGTITLNAPISRRRCRVNWGGFTASASPPASRAISLQRPSENNGDMIGAVAVKVSLDHLEEAWRKGGDIVLLVDK